MLLREQMIFIPLMEVFGHKDPQQQEVEQTTTTANSYTALIGKTGPTHGRCCFEPNTCLSQMMDKLLIELLSNLVLEKVQIGGASDNVIMALIDGDANIYKGINNRPNDSTIVAGNFDTALGTGNKDWVGLAYGAGKWIALAKDGNTVTSNRQWSNMDSRSGCNPGVSRRIQ